MNIQPVSTSGLDRVVSGQFVTSEADLTFAYAFRESQAAKRQIQSFTGINVLSNVPTAFTFAKCASRGGMRKRCECRRRTLEGPHDELWNLSTRMVHGDR
ncbi:hypothetical protein BRAS3843_740025 [Bradyrhizobium sp. STM 3843]|nr:hypothetical protein BRAS3843_740025 [Bradyrhizobium sp. STM 3843]